MKKDLEIKRLKKKSKKLITFFYIAFFSYLMILFTFLYMVVYSPLYSNNNFHEIVSFEENFTEQEKEFAMNIISELKIEYLQTAKSIKFVREIDEDHSGKNWNGHILVKYYNNKEIIKWIICHELIHNIANKFTPEYFIYDISETGVCYGQ